jgi:hypothetical protein
MPKHWKRSSSWLRAVGFGAMGVRLPLLRALAFIDVVIGRAGFCTWCAVRVRHLHRRPNDPVRSAGRYSWLIYCKYVVLLNSAANYPASV